MLLLLTTLACGPAPEASPTTTTPSTTPTPTTPTTPPAPTTPTPTETPSTDGTVTVGGLVFDDHLPTNLLVISLDTTRRDHIGRFSGSDITPHLDAVLDEAYVLENHRTCSNWTGPSMTCVMSGRNPMENGFWPWVSDDQVKGRPPKTYDTLATHLTDAGWRTTLVTANTSVFDLDATGIPKGFEREVDVDWQPAPDVAAAAMTEVGTLTGQAAPWYLHVHFIDPHGNYCPPESYVEGLGGIPDLGYSINDLCYDTYGPGWYDYYYQPQPWRDALVDTYEVLYDAELAYWDDSFGVFWDELDASGALDDTLVMFVTDHGQQFFERGGHGHGLWLGSEENRSTAAFWAKNLTAGAWTGVTLHQDLTETLYTAYGITPDSPTDGTIVGTAPADRVARAMNYWGGGSPVQLSVVRNDRQLVYDWYGGKAYFRLDSDPAGLDDVYDPADPELVSLWGPMDAWISVVETHWPHLGMPASQGP